MSPTDIHWLEWLTNPAGRTFLGFLAQLAGHRPQLGTAGELWHWDGLQPLSAEIKTDVWWKNHLYGRVI